MKHNKRNYLDVESIAKDRVYGATFREIADNYGYSLTAVCRAYKKHKGISHDIRTNNPHGKRNISIEKIVELKKEGLSFSEIATRMKFTTDAVRTKYKNHFMIDTAILTPVISGDEIQNYRLQGKSYQEIADITGCKTESLRKKLCQYKKYMAEIVLENKFKK